MPPDAITIYAVHRRCGEADDPTVTAGDRKGDGEAWSQGCVSGGIWLVDVLGAAASPRWDPEVYVDVAWRRPEQVQGVLIRRLAEGHAPPHKVERRLERLARRLPAGCLRTFTDAEELAAIAPAP